MGESYSAWSLLTLLEGEPMCKPEFVQSDSPTLEVENLRHPCLVQSGYV